MPIDVIISPELEIAKSIQRKLEAPGALDNVPFANNNIRLLEILIKDNCKSINIKFNELTKKYPKLEANVIGIISERDISRYLSSKSIKLDSSITSIMSKNIISCNLKISVSELMETMTNKKIRHMPIIDKNKLLGIVSIGDVVNHIIHKYEAENDALRNYINGFS